MPDLRAWANRFRLPRRAGTREGVPMLRAVLDAASPGLAMVDSDDLLIAWNAEFAALMGPALPLRPGLPAGGLVDPARRDEVGALLSAGHRLNVTLASPGGPQVVMERRILPAGGALLRAEALPAGSPADADEAAAARLRAVGSLAGGIAHDFNNLLTAIGGSAETLLGRFDPQQDSVEELRQIQESAARGAALVRQLLAFARQQSLRPRVLDLNDAVAAMGEFLKRLLGSRVKLTLALEEPGRRVKIDPTQLDQVIMNLALNARDAMAEGGQLSIATSHVLVLRPETIGAELLPPGRWAVLEVTDSGQGISPDVLPRIFDPFFTTRREQGGTGLGLSTVHGIVRQSGGFIGVESEPGQGTTFRIWLPRHDGPADPALPASLIPVPRRAPAAPSAGPCGRSVLLVEDEAPLLRLAERALTRAGFPVVTAGSAEEALVLLDSGMEPPLALISDVVMPGIDGLELATRLRARDPSLPVLLVSGYAEAALGRDLAAERLRLMAKPYHLADLVRELRAMLPPISAEVS